MQTVDYSYDQPLIDRARRRQGPFFDVYAFPEVAVVMGRGSKIQLEVISETVTADGVALLRRAGGGCSVVLDPGNIVVSVASPLAGLGGNRLAFRLLTEWVIAGLKRCGIPQVTSDGISDLVLNDRKIGGSCIHRSKDLLYYSTTVLFDPQLNLVERYLKHPPREPEYRRGRDHSQFMGSVKHLLRGVDSKAFAAQLRQQLEKSPLTALVQKLQPAVAAGSPQVAEPKPVSSGI